MPQPVGDISTPGLQEWASALHRFLIYNDSSDTSFSDDPERAINTYMRICKELRRRNPSLDELIGVAEDVGEKS